MTESKILEYMTNQYNLTGWQYVTFTTLSNLFGMDVSKKELNRLFALKLIKKRECVHGVLIELIIEK